MKTKAKDHARLVLSKELRRTIKKIKKRLKKLGATSGGKR